MEEGGGGMGGGVSDGHFWPHLWSQGTAEIRYVTVRNGS